MLKTIKQIKHKNLNELNQETHANPIKQRKRSLKEYSIYLGS